MNANRFKPHRLPAAARMAALAVVALSAAACATRGVAPGAPGAQARGPDGLDGPDTRPNILLVTLDDAHHQSFGATGHPTIRTPHVDRLAARGLVFANATAATPLCSPNRTTMLTGRFSHDHGVTQIASQVRRTVDRERLIDLSVPRRLNDAGYETLFAGKWHVPVPPWKAGFEKAEHILRKPGETEGTGRTRVAARPEAGATDEIAGTALAFLAERDETRPFFLWVSFHAPHVPFDPVAEYRDRYRDVSAATLRPPGHAPPPEESKAGSPGGGDDAESWRDYAALITHVDARIGGLLDRLRDAGAMEGTAVFVTSDNGIAFRSIHGPAGKRAPTEDSLRVPLVAAFPGADRPGRTIEAPVSSADLPATWLDLAGLDPAAAPHGDSLLPLVGGQDEPAGWRATSYAEFDKPGPQDAAASRFRLVRSPGGKLVLRADGSTALYDLSRDPHERRDIIDEPAARGLADALEAEMNRWIDRTGDRDAARWTRWTRPAARPDR